MQVTVEKTFNGKVVASATTTAKNAEELLAFVYKMGAVETLEEARRAFIYDSVVYQVEIKDTEGMH
jgi:hypothetical protein